MLGVQCSGPLAPHCGSASPSRVSEAGAVPAGGLRGGSQPRRAIEADPLALEGGRRPETPAAGDAQSAERDAWVVLLGVPGLGPVTFTALLTAFGSARAVLAVAAGPNGAVRLQEAMADRAGDDSGSWDDSRQAPDEGPGAERPLGRATARPGAAARTPGADLAARIRRQADDADRTLSVVRSLGLTVVTLDDAEFPERLRQVEMPPPLLFVRGSTSALNATSAVAVVGTRRPSDKGRMIAGWIGSALACAGSVVVSGLAVGIDGAAHAAVVGEGRATVAVLGGGHARLFPNAHERLADAIVAAGGAVVAELPPETPATRGTFPRRNRLISGLSDATVVVEAGRRSGALITAGWALEQGRECFLVPGPFDAPTSEGCHAFLRSFPGQARVVCGIPELIEDLGLAAAGAGPAATAAGQGHGPSGSISGAGPAAVLAALGPTERQVAEILAAGPATADDLASRTGLSGGAILSALTLLELRGLAVGAYGRYVPTGSLARWPGRPGGVSGRPRQPAR